MSPKKSKPRRPPARVSKKKPAKIKLAAPGRNLQASQPTTLAGPIFGEDDVNAPNVPPQFENPATVTSVYNQIQPLLHTQVTAYSPMRGNPGDLFSLAALGPRGTAMAAAIQKNGRVVFHMIGDSGASQGSKYQNETSVADHLVSDCVTSKGNDIPSFLFHLGDLVYDFGQSEYYFSQVYEPLEHYPGPIFAVPGNHDSFLVPGTAAGDEPLTTFQRNFCATGFQITPEAGHLHRTAMVQPGVYFALDVPFVRILGLFSNALEGPGVISSEGGHWPLPDAQLAFLTAQLTAIKTSGYAGAVVIAIHHPPFSYWPKTDKYPGGSPNMLKQIDQICLATGVYPHAVISGHAHNSQRYTRKFTFAGKPYQVPFVVSGVGGFNLDPIARGTAGAPATPPKPRTSVAYMDSGAAVASTDLTYEYGQSSAYGYLRVSADPQTLNIDFMTVGATGAAPVRADSVAVQLSTHTLAADGI